MDPAARLASHWAYLEGDEVVVGWHTEAELDTREYRIEAGDGSGWETVAVVVKGETVAPDVYSVGVKPGYEYYRIVEIDHYGARCVFHPMPVAAAAPGYLADLMEAAGRIDEAGVKPKAPLVSCSSAGLRLEDTSEEVPDWVFYGPDSLLAECGPAISWFEGEGLVVDMVCAASPDY
jgi:hypothetical protein